MFEGFERRRVATAGCDINLVLGGNGPPLLLLHGFPQSHVCWHRVAPLLAPHFTLVVPDLRGYGDSGKPASDPEHYPYSKRAMALDQVQVMAALGFDRFGVAGHDRGGRVAHRMALDHPDRVSKVAVLDIVPTRTIYRATNQGIATDYYHWFFLIQPFDFPERLIGADSDYYFHAHARRLGQPARCLRAGSSGRVPALLPRPGHDPCRLRRLPRRRHDRSRPRRGRHRQQDRIPTAGTLGQARHHGEVFRRPRDLARARRRGSRASPRLRALPAGGGARGDRRGPAGVLQGVAGLPDAPLAH